MAVVSEIEAIAAIEAGRRIVGEHLVDMEAILWRAAPYDLKKEMAPMLSPSEHWAEEHGFASIGLLLAMREQAERDGATGLVENINVSVGTLTTLHCSMGASDAD